MQNAECRIKCSSYNRIIRIIPYHPISRDTVIRFDTLC